MELHHQARTHSEMHYRPIGEIVRKALAYTERGITINVINHSKKPDQLRYAEGDVNSLFSLAYILIKKGEDLEIVVASENPDHELLLRAAGEAIKTAFEEQYIYQDHPFTDGGRKGIEATLRRIGKLKKSEKH